MLFFTIFAKLSKLNENNLLSTRMFLRLLKQICSFIWLLFWLQIIIIWKSIRTCESTFILWRNCTYTVLNILTCCLTCIGVALFLPTVYILKPVKKAFLRGVSRVNPYVEGIKNILHSFVCTLKPLLFKWYRNESIRSIFLLALPFNPLEEVIIYYKETIIWVPGLVSNNFHSS